jgi:hypothetical protein
MGIADIAFDWSTEVAGLRSYLVEAVQANMGAILQLFGLLVAVNFVFGMIARVVGSGRPSTDRDREG